MFSLLNKNVMLIHMASDFLMGLMVGMLGITKSSTMLTLSVFMLAFLSVLRLLVSLREK